MQLPTPRDIRTAFPLSPDSASFVLSSREKGRAIIQARDNRLLLIAGPCSIHDQSAALEYARHFKALAQQVEDTCFLVMRVYVEKPRTTTGWKGLLHDPHLDGSHDIRTGLLWARELLVELAELGVPTATEFLDPLFAPYIADLIAWGFIGARTSASQTHRQLASWLPMPVGFKNGVDGMLDHAVQGIVSAASGHVFPHLDDEGRISVAHGAGNECAHLVLRGSSLGSNYDPHSVALAVHKLKAYGLPPRLLIDCSHGNCGRRYERQEEGFLSVLAQMEGGNSHLMGMMLESHLEAGSQLPSSPLKYAVSITDPCIGWAKTKELVLSAHATLSALPLRG
jgi:3-deoxy-7-phosphoheptulonate synthase